jgi:SAM-dependent methyltransferase
MGDFARYLLAKRSVDERALNRKVWGRLETELKSSATGTLRIIDAGAGIGTGAERIAEWRLAEPLSKIRYTGLEPRKELLEEGTPRLRTLPFPAELVGTTLEAFASRVENRGRFDLVVAHALLDLLDLAPALEALVGLARPGGLLYLPITFDGETIFEPASSLDDDVLTAYHDTMEGRGRTGRRIFHQLRTFAVEVLEMGSSDWMVHPNHPKRGGYPGDEAFFLEFLLATIEGAVRERVEGSILEKWVSERRRQLESADLVYGAHQLDVLARRES